VIPDNILTRPPSAELKPDQCDQDSLPPYEVLDAIIAAYMEEDLSPREIVARGYPEADVRRAVAMLRRNEYKRRQAPPGVASPSAASARTGATRSPPLPRRLNANHHEAGFNRPGNSSRPPDHSKENIR
jgi:hypothetical protein